MSGLEIRVVNGDKALLCWPNGADEYRDAINEADASEHWLSDDPWSDDAKAARQDQDDLEQLRVLEVSDTDINTLILRLYRVREQMCAQRQQQRAVYTIPDRQTSSRD